MTTSYRERDYDRIGSCNDRRNDRLQDRQLE
jgi:hypothetical protein